MLTFISDTGMVNAMRLPHGEKPWSLSVSLDHMIHFHRPLDILVEEWMVLIYETRVSTAARGLSQCLCFNLAGQLLATIAQEGLIRPAQEKESSKL
mmetsp:Transcript_11056/g.20442  ORF Transcript_11056/g.20442 Transcript_11056/m.20442 type:complete len:96 (+) Transcript_11056:1-288(+)